MDEFLCDWMSISEIVEAKRNIRYIISKLSTLEIWKEFNSLVGLINSSDEDTKEKYVLPKLRKQSSIMLSLVATIKVLSEALIGPGYILRSRPLSRININPKPNNIDGLEEVKDLMVKEGAVHVIFSIVVLSSLGKLDGIGVNKPTEVYLKEITVSMNQNGEPYANVVLMYDGDLIGAESAGRIIKGVLEYTYCIRVTTSLRPLQNGGI